MKVFELAWTWYEDYIPHLFSHSSKTIEEFREDVKSLLIKYGQEYLDQEESWAGAPDWIDYVANKIPELGYERINPERVSFFGAFIIEGNDEDDDEFGKIIGEDLYKKAIEHNNKLRKEMEK